MITRQVWFFLGQIYKASFQPDTKNSAYDNVYDSVDVSEELRKFKSSILSKRYTKSKFMFTGEVSFRVFTSPVLTLKGPGFLVYLKFEGGGG